MTDDALRERNISQKQKAYQELSDYMNAHNYGSKDLNTYSKDPEWVRLHRAAFPQSSFHNNVDESTIQHQCSYAALETYMFSHKYTINQQDIYIRDPQWQQLHRDAYPSSLLPIQGFIKDINPNYDPFSVDINDPYHNNCGSCALAVEERLSGKNPTAYAGEYNLGYNCNMEAATKGNVVPSSREAIEQMLYDKGVGSHLIVGINRTNGPGHWFNVFFNGKEINIIDGQIGKILDWSYDYVNVESWEVLKLK